MPACKIQLILLLLLVATIGAAADKTIGVFVALADNKSQGIVPAKIGNGDDPEQNLYWGTADGLKGFFDRSKSWKLGDQTNASNSGDVLRTRTYRHANAPIVVHARAYKGSSIKKCTLDFEAAVRSGSYELVVYIGHNGLMDFDLPKPQPATTQRRQTDCAVLCCRSQSYFDPRIKALGGRPILLTTQLMYPGSFLVDAIAEKWTAGAPVTEIRKSAATAYALNQKISTNAALKIFAELSEPALKGQK